MSNNSDYMPQNKDEFLKWLRNFLEIAIANINHYGINEEEIKSLKEFTENVPEKLTKQ